MAKNKKKALAVQGSAKGNKPALPTQTFEADVDGEKLEYKFKVPVFRLGAKLVTAEEALEDPKILAHLVEVKAGVIELVESETESEGGE